MYELNLCEKLPSAFVARGKTLSIDMSRIKKIELWDSKGWQGDIHVEVDQIQLELRPDGVISSKVLKSNQHKLSQVIDFKRPMEKV